MLNSFRRTFRVLRAVTPALACVALLWLGLARAGAASAAGVVTDCSSDSQLRTLLAGGGNVSFNCGGANNPATIVVGSPLGVAAGNTTLDGGGKITLSGGDSSRVFVADAGIFGEPRAITLTHITLTNGYAAEAGGCIYIGFSTAVVLDDASLQYCRTAFAGRGGAVYGGLGSLRILNSRLLYNEAGIGGAIRSDFSPLTLSNSFVAHNRAISDTGGGLGIGPTSAVVSGTTFYSNSAIVGGGGISADSGAVLRIAGSRIENNRARDPAGQTFGGGIRSAGTLIISTTTIASNTANVGASSTFGGGLHHEGASLWLKDVVFQQNRSIHGAGLNIAGGSTVMTSVTFANNFATLASGDGAGLRVWAGNVSIANALFSNNYAAREGGGIYNRGTLTVSNSTLNGNGSYDGGGALLNWFGTTALLNSVLSGNNATGGGTGYGGAILNRTGEVALIGSLVHGNSANYDGGGIFNGGTLVISGATVSNNTTNGGDGISTAYGGGGIFNSGTATIGFSTIRDNRTLQLDGGGLYNRNGNMYVSNATVNGNIAADDGGGIKNEDGTLTLLNATVSGNGAAAWGGGIFSDHGQTELRHATLSGNKAAAGGGIYQLTVYPNRTVFLQNSIIANSVGANCAQFAGSLDVVSGGYNLSDDNAFATFCPSFQLSDLGNANDNLGPLADHGGATRTHLPLPGSAAVDAIPIAVNGCGTIFTGDQRQQPRPVNGNANPAVACDIGAVEYVLGERTPWLYLPVIRR